MALAAAGELRTYLGLDPLDTAELPDALADLVLEGVSAAVLTYCRRTGFLVEEVTVRVSGTGVGEVLLPGAPVTAIDSVIEDPDGDTPTELVVGTDVEWSEDGILARPGGRFVRRRQWYEVTFSHGYAEVPADVKLVVLRVAARAITNPEGLATEGTGGYNAGFAFDDTRLPTLSRPDRRDLDEYRL